jgi:hypothetical protein
MALPTIALRATVKVILKTACESNKGTFDSNTNTCTQTSTSYLSLLTAPTQTTLTGSTKFPASTQITVQKK